MPSLSANPINASRSSTMVAITRPVRWGYEIVDVFFGETRVRADQGIAVAGDLLRDLDTGEIVALRGRDGAHLLTSEC